MVYLLRIQIVKDKAEYVTSDGIYVFIHVRRPDYYNRKKNLLNAWQDVTEQLAVGNEAVFFYFIKETGTSGQDKYVMVSTFEKEEPRGHCRRPHTLLKKTKVNKVSGAATIIFDFNNK